MQSLAFFELHNMNRAETVSGKLMFLDISLLCHFQIMKALFY